VAVLTGKLRVVAESFGLNHSIEERALSLIMGAPVNAGRFQAELLCADNAVLHLMAGRLVGSTNQLAT
jgi:hypothetical protein